MAFTSFAIAISAGFGVWVLYGLLALWVGSRPWHWFFRVALMIAAVTPMLSIEAPDLAIVLLSCVAVIYFPVAYVTKQRNWVDAEHRRNKSARGDESKLRTTSILTRPKWHLSDLLLATAAMATVFFLLTRDLSGQNIRLPDAILAGFVIGSVMLSVIFLVLGRLNWKWKFLMLVIGIVIATAAQPLFLTKSSPGPTAFSAIDSIVHSLSGMIPASAALMFAVLLFAYRIGFVSSSIDPAKIRPMGHTKKLVIGFAKIIAVGIVVACVATTFFVYAQLARPVAIIDTNLPTSDEPNGYLELLEAGEKLAASNLFNGRNGSTPSSTVRAEVDTYQRSFDKVKDALDRKFLTARTGKPNSMDILVQQLSNVHTIRAIARALAVKSRQELFEGNDDVALNDGVQCMRLSLPEFRSQLIVNILVGCAIESIGHPAVHNAIDSSSSEALQKALESIVDLDSMHFDAARAVQTEHDLFWEYSNWKFRIFMLLQETNDWSTSQNQISVAYLRTQSVRRILIVEIALEIYRRDHQRYPAKLQELVPVYLNSIPADPWSAKLTGEPLIYQCAADANSFNLYSIGIDRQDNGGRLGKNNYWADEGSDINFAEYCRRGNN